MIRLFKVAMHPSAKDLVGQVLDSGYIGEGPKVKEFEAKLETVLGHKVLAVNSCTSAHRPRLHLCDVGPGSEVIVTPMTCSATVTMVANRKAKIVWADVDPDTGLISSYDVLHKMTGSQRPSSPSIGVGRFATSNSCVESARDRHKAIPIIEDAAHVFGVNMQVTGTGCRATPTVTCAATISPTFRRSST